MQTTTSNDPILKLNSTGATVRELQELLNKRLSAPQRLSVDGIFGESTEIAVKQVQFQFLLKQDGIAGPQTWQSLRADAPVGKPVLRRGSVGEDVERVQNVLKIVSLYSGVTDGNFGSATEAAVKKLQQNKGLIVDGVISNQTWKVLSELATFLSID